MKPGHFFHRQQEVGLAELVLNVDDFEPQRYRRTAVLRAAGFDVLEAGTAARTLEIAWEKRPTLILLDVDLPDGDGLDVCRRIKSDPALAQTLVLHISAKFRDAVARVRALENGADGYLAEPVEADELVAEVRSLLRLARAEAKARRAEEALRESTRLLRAISDTSNDAIYAKDLSGRMRFANPATVGPLGKTMLEVLGRTEEEFLDDREAARRVRDVDREVMASGTPTVVEEVVSGADGEPRVWLSSKVPYRGPDGLVIGLLGISRDITDRKRTEEALRRSEERYRTLVESAPHGVLIIRGDRIVYANPTMVTLLGASCQADLLGRSVFDIFHPDSHAVVQERIDALRGGRAVPPIEEKMRRLDGEVLQVEVRAAPCDYQDAAAVQVVVRDITEQKRLEQELRDANRIKDEFLATLSHELRTPLNAIVGWSKLLERGLDEATTKQAVQAIARNADAQHKLITDVLDMSRMISGKLRLRVRDVDLAEITALAVESARPAFEAKGVRLVLSNLDAPAPVTGDPDRLQQIAWNLLSNAAKFTPRGGRVAVSIERRDGMFDLVVADTGIGIRSDFLPHAFDRFSQADASMARRHGGLGLGLSIVRQLVELQGGRVVAASEGEGKGTTFTVTLPGRTGEPPTENPGGERT